MWLLVKRSLLYWRICWLRLRNKNGTAGKSSLVVLACLGFEHDTRTHAPQWGGLPLPTRAIAVSRSGV